ncbi:MAG: methylenetetrahydrofolate reductase [NAD(P)H] [Candidatus Omnitrophota bacterium]
MKISQILKERPQGVSFEFFPPKTDVGMKTLAETVHALRAHKPLYMSMTCGAGGSAQEKTRDAIDFLLGEKDLVVMPHVTCIGQKRSTIQKLLNEYKEAGIENLMLLRGDPPQGGTDLEDPMQEFRYARDLVAFAKAWNHFCIGVAVYPEGHIQTASLQEDLLYAKQKIDAGADFAVTQMFFDNTYFYAMVERMRKAGIAIPILPGILPLTDVAKVKQFASLCRATIPKKIEAAMSRCEGRPTEMEKTGIDFTIQQCRDLIRNGFQKLHFFTLNKVRIFEAILRAI